MKFKHRHYTRRKVVKWLALDWIFSEMSPPNLTVTTNQLLILNTTTNQNGAPAPSIPLSDPIKENGRIRSCFPCRMCRTASAAQRYCNGCPFCSSVFLNCLIHNESTWIFYCFIKTSHCNYDLCDLIWDFF